MEAKVWDQLLYLYDWHIRRVAEVQEQIDRGVKVSEDYDCGYADAIGQVILDLAKIYNQDTVPEWQRFEAYRRVMRFTNAAQYVTDYPNPIERPVIHL